MTDELFLRLIHPLPLRGRIRVDPAELESLKELSIAHNLRLLLYNRLKDPKEGIIPQGEVLKFLEETSPLYYKNVVRTIKQQETAAKTVSLLKAQGIPAIVFRGSEIAEEIHGDPFCRVSADIDILVRISDTLKADEIMTSSGFSRTDSLPLRFLLTRLHHAVYHDTDNAVIIEIHWDFGIPSYFNLSSEEIWKGAASSEKEQQGLSPEMMLIQLLIHHHMHAFRELKILVDILWTLDRYEKNIDWTKFIATIESIGLLKVTLITLSQIRNVWKDTKMIKAEEILSNVFSRGRHKAPAYLLSFFSLDIKKKYQFQVRKDKFMCRLALDRWNTILQSFTKTFFPSSDAIKALYGNCRNWLLPVNYLRFIIWRIQDRTK